MSGRVNSKLLLLLVVVLAAVAWFVFLDGDGDRRARDDDARGGDANRGAASVDPMSGVEATLLSLPFEDGYRAQLQVVIDPTRYPGGEVTLAEVYEVEIRFADLDPPIADLESTGLLHRGWNERDVAGGHRYFTTEDPLPRDGSPAKWQFQFDTSPQAGRGPKLKSGRVRLYDREGELVGVKDLTIR